MERRYFDEAAGALPDAFFERVPDLGIVLGSGWGEALRVDRVISRVRYADIPGYGAASVAGHAGEAILFERSGRLVIAFSGRRHRYEGVKDEVTVMPVELMRRMGVKRLLLTNATGGVNPALRPGDIAIVKDHIDLTGSNPLVGAHDPEWGARFPDMTEIYDRNLRGLLRAAANSLGIGVGEVVYQYTVGPVFETPAEIRAYRSLGADVVGMSTVQESVFAHACGMKVAALSLVANRAAGVADGPILHEEVLAACEAARPVMASLVDAFLERL